MIKDFLSIFRESPNTFEGQKENEKVFLILRRHPFFILTRVGFSVLAGLLPILIALETYNYLSNHELLNLFLFVSSLWYLTLWLVTFHALSLYTLNIVIITDQRIIDNDQHNLFNRKVSELHIHRVQDVSIHTSGMIQTFLKFGDVIVQTAGVEKHFIFHQVPHPEIIKDTIMQITGAEHSGVMPPTNTVAPKTA